MASDFASAALIKELAQFSVYFIRHGEVPSNLAGRRCGAECVEALTDRGLEQVFRLGLSLRQKSWRPGVILCGDLLRVRQSAMLLSAAFDAAPMEICPRLDERRLGEWNGLPVSETEPDLQAGVTPPGGESEQEFAARVDDALVSDILPRLSEMPLIVSSKGVARMMFQLLGGTTRLNLENAKLVAFKVTQSSNRQPVAEMVSV